MGVGRRKVKGEGRAPADLHPPLNKKGGLEGIVDGLDYLFLLAHEDAAGVSWIAAVEGEQQIQSWEVKDINLLDTAPASVCPSYELPCDAFIPTTQLLLLMTTTLTLHPNA